MVRSRIWLTLIAIAIPTAVLAALTSSSVPVHTHASNAQGGATLALTGTLSSTKACASGYTRISPNYCANTAGLSTTGLVRDSCTAVTLPSADAKALVIHAQVLVHAANAVAFRFSAVDGYNDAGCATILGSVRARLQEFVATISGNIIGGGDGVLILPGTTPYLKHSDDAGNTSTAGYQIRGYFD